MPAEAWRARGAGPARRPPLTAQEWRTVGVLVLLLPVFGLAAIGNAEIFNAYLIWGKANFQLEFFGQTMPISWLLSLDAFVSVITIALSMAFWRWWARRWREPDEIVKIGFGALISALAPLILAAASVHAASGHKIGLAWGLGFHIVNDIGFANAYVVGLALYSRAAPPSLGATVVNGYSLSLFLTNLMVGRLAGLLSQMSGAAFWSLHAGLIAAAAVILLICGRLFHRTLAPRDPAEHGAVVKAQPSPSH
jgi:POT family proton-dependent oligopeptide transporter